MKPLAICAVLSMSVLSGCTREIVIREVAPTTVEVATTTTEPTPTTAAFVSTEDLFIADVRSNTDLLLSDSQLIEFALLVCRYLSSGGTNEGLMELMYESVMSNGLTEQDAYDFAYVSGAGVAAFCPENSYLLY